jgi:hypothetical protein
MRGYVASAVVTGVLIGAPAFAHHSFAPHFDSSKPVSISGVITEFEGRNPHSYVHIQAVDENGRRRSTSASRTASRSSRATASRRRS